MRAGDGVRVPLLLLLVPPCAATAHLARQASPLQCASARPWCAAPAPCSDTTSAGLSCAALVSANGCDTVVNTYGVAACLACACAPDKWDPHASPSPPATGACSGVVGACTGVPTAEQQQRIVDAHNVFRGAHGSCEVAWSDDLAVAAAQSRGLADTCASGALVPNRGWGYGENTGEVADASDVHAWDPSPVVRGWYCGEEGCYDYDALAGSPETARFSQLLWRGSAAVGCGVCQINDGTGGPIQKFIFCSYKGPGNAAGQHPANVLPPGSPAVGCPTPAPPTPAPPTSAPAPASLPPTPSPPTPAPPNATATGNATAITSVTATRNVSVTSKAATLTGANTTATVNATATATPGGGNGTDVPTTGVGPMPLPPSPVPTLPMPPAGTGTGTGNTTATATNAPGAPAAPPPVAPPPPPPGGDSSTTATSGSRGRASVDNAPTPSPAAPRDTGAAPADAAPWSATDAPIDRWAPPYRSSPAYDVWAEAPAYDEALEARAAAQHEADSNLAMNLFIIFISLIAAVVCIGVFMRHRRAKRYDVADVVACDREMMAADPFDFHARAVSNRASESNPPTWAPPTGAVKGTTPMSQPLVDASRVSSPSTMSDPLGK